MNLLNAGIGADDAFIFVKLWNCSIVERVKSLGLPASTTSSFATNASYPDTLAGLMSATLKHAAASILVTSLTTALAFYTSYLSAITAIRCFGWVRAGTRSIEADKIKEIFWLLQDICWYSSADKLHFHGDLAACRRVNQRTLELRVFYAADWLSFSAEGHQLHQ